MSDESYGFPVGRILKEMFVGNKGEFLSGYMVYQSFKEIQEIFTVIDPEKKFL